MTHPARAQLQHSAHLNTEARALIAASRLLLRDAWRLLGEMWAELRNPAPQPSSHVRNVNPQHGRIPAR